MEAAAGCRWGYMGPLTPLQEPMSRAGQAAATRTLERGGEAIRGGLCPHPTDGTGHPLPLLAGSPLPTYDVGNAEARAHFQEEVV